MTPQAQPYKIRYQPCIRGDFVDLSGQLVLAYLEEDDSKRVLFRVRPLLSAQGAFSPEDLETYDLEGFLRVAPDRQEQHSFKDRMRSLGSLCVIDLRATQTHLGKVRPNKNYAPDRGENNRYIVYSDVVQALPAGLLYEVVGEDRSAFALTRQYYLRSGGRITGPHCREGALACPDSQVLMPDCERLFLVEMPDRTSRMFYWPQGQEELVPLPEPVQELVEEPEPHFQLDAAQEEQVEQLPSQPRQDKGGQLLLEAAAQLQRAFLYAGFLMDESQALGLLMLCLSSPRLQLQADRLADACLGAQVLSRLFVKGQIHSCRHCGDEQEGAAMQVLYEQDFLREKNQKAYVRQPWPVVALAVGPGYPKPDPSPALLDRKALQAACSTQLLKDQAGLLALFASLQEAGCPLPLMLRGQMAAFLGRSQAVLGEQGFDAAAFARVVYALPSLLSSGKSLEEAMELLAL